MLKKIWQFLSSLSPVKKYMLLASVGVVGGMLISFLYIIDAPLYATTKTEMCVSCHVMQSQYSTWNHGSHRRYAGCCDCHLPHDSFLHKYYVKARDGTKDFVTFQLHAESNIMHATEDTKKNIQKNCERCHMHTIDNVMKSIAASEENKGIYCWRCHNQIPHGQVHGLASVIRADAQLKDIPIPEWLSEKMKKIE